MKPRAIDIHAHALIEAVEKLARGQAGWRREVEMAARVTGAASLERNRQRMANDWQPALTSVEKRIAAMDRMTVDIQAVSVVPSQYHYWADRELAERIVATANQRIAEICAERPDRLVGLGIVALQHPDLAVVQLQRAVGELGLRGVMVSTAVNDAELADQRHLPFWSKAEELGALVFIHPMGCSLGERLIPFYFSNLIGNPAETTVALAHLVFSGVFDRCPRLRVCAAHGGGYFPFYSARFDHGWRVRPEAHTCRLAPSEYLKRIWFDSLVYTPEQLGFLMRQAGPSQIVLGSDFPFDMGVDDPVARLDRLMPLSGTDRSAICGGNAAKLLGI
ncbi:MAG TPA: amidohydrolase family protein [Candidatus Binataceae bacterium]|nr:amidohydrolase family protein [Candidatus Binataceae bacterium]